MTSLAMWALSVALLVGFISPPEVESYKIMMFAGGTKSHKYVFDAVAEELGKRGHEVSIYSPHKDDKQVKGVRNIYLAGGDEAMTAAKINFFQGTMEDRAFLLSMIGIISNVVNKTYSDPAIQTMLKNPRNSKGEPLFDAVMIDSIFGEFILPLAHHLEVPAIYLSPSLIFPSIAHRLNIPYPYSYLTSGFEANIHPKCMLERAVNAFKIMGFNYFREHEFQPALDKVIQTILPNVPTIAELERRVSFMMINWNIGVYPSAPRMPYFVDVGCLNCKDPKPLPKDLEDFMNSSPDGVVYFSLGSFTQGNNMPPEMRDKLVKAFSKIKQMVIWKYEDAIDGLSPNVKLMTWAPQNDLLGHPKLKLFITHGGGLSMMESAYNACPQLAFPLSADQHENMAYAKNKGFAEILDWKTFTEEEFSAILDRMLNDKSYAENAAKVSRIMKDNPQDPKEKAAYWVEYVIRHKGAPHLKSGAENLNFFQYFLLDVIGALVLVLTIVLVILFVVLRAAFRLLFGKKKTKKSDKKTN